MPNADNEPQIPKNQSPITDDRTGMVSRDWYRFFLNLLNKANSGGGGGSGTVTSVNVSGGTTGLTTSGGPVTTSGTITLAGTLDVDNGGTGQTTAAAAITALTGTQTSGYYLRSNGTNAALSAIQVADVPTLNQNTTGQAGSVANALTAGTGISYSVGTTYNGSVAVTIDNSAPDQVVSLTGGTGISTSGTYPSFTITNTAPDQVVSLTGGTGISTSGTYPSFTVTNTAPDQVVSIAAGTGMSVTGTYPSFTVTNTAPDQIVSLTGAGTTSVTGAYPNFTITSNDQYVGTVTSVSGTGTVNGISLSGTVTSSGSLTLGGTLSNVSLTTQVTGTLPIANGGTGQTTASAAFNALSPVTSTGDLIIGNGANSSTRLPIGANNYVLTSNGTTAVWAVASGSGATITNDTSTSTNVYPTFAAATSGALSTIYTSNAKYLYKPSTGELTSEHFIAGNGIFVNNLTIDVSYTIAAGTSGMSAGPVTVASGTTVTVASGSRWVVM
jgi:trimeric autotransporter adhesin